MDDKSKMHRTTVLEFGGPLGALLLPMLLPCTLLYLLLACRTQDASVFKVPSALPTPSELWDLDMFLLVLGWFSLQAVLYMLPLGKVTQGMPLRDGSRLSYRINGLQAFAITTLLAGLGIFVGLRLSSVHDRCVQLAVSAIVASFALSIFLYARSLCVPESALAPGGNSGNPIYDFFIGHELNPRIGSFDLKYFCELRPGLIGWLVINLAMLMKESELRGSPSLAMILVNSFQLLYVLDALWHEEAVLTTMDIVNDGFGFMLAFGDLAWVPFTYSLQAYFLVSHPQELTTTTAAAIILLNVQTHRRTLSAGTPMILKWRGWRRSPRQPGDSFWSRAGGAWCDTRTISGI
ncbi:delta(14)-sterol reductase TM7SF2 isoform X2 [Carcharodon carcharias]|uniref:delta(14)-sterol reductase TM7SF2 isoform X2 n=1 Tax=Carcharodon carcharias TaxID=13397 RepID=UPI001B7E0D03|nr:delta(14)-sterol reductase TM7SF2 isoform X2 [Carcharodon carcharias]